MIMIVAFTIFLIEGMFYLEIVRRECLYRIKYKTFIAKNVLHCISNRMETILVTYYSEKEWSGSMVRKNIPQTVKSF